MLRVDAPTALKDTAVVAEMDAQRLLQDADRLKTMVEWLEGVCRLHRYRDDTRSCREAESALVEAIRQIGVAAGHINTLMRREP